MNPTLEQLEDAGLVLITKQSDMLAALSRGYPLRVFEAGKFPELKTVYVSKNWQVTPTPSVVYPLGIAPPPVASGLVRQFFDDFVESGVDLTRYYVYDGTPGGTDGKWLTSHVVQQGDSLLRLQAYQDALGGDSEALDWVGGGLQTITRWPVGSLVSVSMEDDMLAGFTAILLLMGQNWPPEIDFDEGGNAFIHWGKGNSQQGFTIPSKYNDTNPHMWQCYFGATIISCWVDGELIGSMPNPDTDATDPNSFTQPMFLAAQYQSGDGGVLANNPAVTATAPKEQRLDWICVDVPA